MTYAMVLAINGVQIWEMNVDVWKVKWKVAKANNFPETTNNLLSSSWQITRFNSMYVWDNLLFWIFKRALLILLKLWLSWLFLQTWVQIYFPSKDVIKFKRAFPPQRISLKPPKRGKKRFDENAGDNNDSNRKRSALFCSECFW